MGFFGIWLIEDYRKLSGEGNGEGAANNEKLWFWTLVSQCGAQSVQICVGSSHVKYIQIS